MTLKTDWSTHRQRSNPCRGKNRPQRPILIGTTLYYYPRTKRLAPTLYDPALQKAVRRSLSQARAILAQRGSDWVIGCVLLDVQQGQGYWLGEDDGDLRKNQCPNRETK